MIEAGGFRQDQRREVHNMSENMNQEPILDQLLRDPNSDETLLRVANSKLDDFTMSVPDDPRLLVRPSVDEQIMLAAAARKELENRGLEWRPKPVPKPDQKYEVGSEAHIDALLSKAAARMETPRTKRR